MEIKYMGDSRIFIKGKKENVWINPNKDDFARKSNLARIVVFTEDKLNFVKIGQEEERVIICGPGEYEIGGVEITGINSMYSLNVDGVKVVMVGKGEGELGEKKKEKLEESDVLLLELSANSLDIAKKSAANYLVPVGYESEEKELKIFLDAFDNEDLEKVDSLKVDKDNLPEGVEVVLLKTME